MMNLDKGDISLRDLAIKNDLTTRLVNTCVDSGLTSLKLILEFYEKNKSFMFIRKCGSKTDKELIELCKKYYDWKPTVEIVDNIDIYNRTFQDNTFEMLSLNEADISLEELADKEFLSVRSIRICENADLTSLKRILDFYEKRKSFLFIRNCGIKTEVELVELCKRYQHRKPIVERDDFKNISNAINSFTPIQKATLNRHFEYLISNLSVRAYNALHNVSETLNPKEIFDKIFIERFDFKVFISVGNKSAEELDKFKKDISNFIEMLLKIKNEQISKEYAKLIIKPHFTNRHQNFEEQIESAFDHNGKIKLFRLIELLINSEQFLNKNETRIFRLSYCTENSEKETLESVGAELQLTRERVRQIKIKIEDEIQNYFLFISNFVADDIVNYGIDNIKSFQVIDKYIINKINQVEGVNFNSTFYSIIFGIFLTKSHSVLGDNESINGKRKSTNTNNYKNCYLIEKSIFEYFDFLKFVEDVNTKITEKITETYSVHFEGYLCMFTNEIRLRYLSEIKTVCEAIIFNEFDLVVDSVGYLEIEKKTNKQLHKYCYEILEEFSNPMTLDEIEKALNEKHPDVKKTTDSIRGSLLREKELFVCIGRTSTYALRKWEKEKENLKGGTIKNIIEDYLIQEGKPKHISEIVEHVAKYRKTNERSVLTNLKINNNNKFVFFSNRFVGLVSKNYSESYIIQKFEIKNWDERFQELKMFRELHNDRWPSGISSNSVERALYLFGYKARKAFQKNGLDRKKEELFRSINFPLDETNTRTNDWHTEVEKLIAFHNSEQKWPNAASDNKEERALYRFCYLNKKAFQNQELSDDKIEILKNINFNFNLLR